MDSLPLDHFVTSFQFTKRAERDQYPSIDPSSPELSMAGKVVIVTGASRGIGGLGLAPAFAKAGAKAIVLVARDAAKLEETAARINKSHPSVETLVAPTDISSEESVSKLYEQISTKYGHADILVNNAAVNPAFGPMTETSPEQWWKGFEINARGPLIMTTHFLRALPATSRGTIITITSGLGWLVSPGHSSYSLAKTMNVQMSAYVAAEHPNVTAVSLHPGIVPTDLTTDDFRRFALDTPELVGGTVVWLATEKARFMNGRVMAANWHVEDLYERREEILKGNQLTLGLQGTFGLEQFQK